MSTPTAALCIPRVSLRSTIPRIIPKLYKTGEIAKEKKRLYVISIFPRVLLIANMNADGSISLVMNIMLCCPSTATLGKTNGMILSMKIKATVLSTMIKREAPDSIVFAKDSASFLSLCR